MSKLPSFLDFEASSLSSRSYPIEVAWSLPDGSIESHLISPAGIETWTDWDRESEKVHGIPRAELLAHGESPWTICRLMNQQLFRKTVYTDNPGYDGMWLAVLFSATPGIRLKFRLGLIDDLLFGRTYPDPQSRAGINAMKQAARNRVGGQHRARLDVQYLIELHRIAAGTYDND